jgi:hypothetical protein|mmetsp:Transcript_67101/g.106220  ORF Transcript_67101/g.106220 Transcript_67101/m.106220 type:complete len:350 (-) Transcript_67101:100-1149(-)
MEATLSASMSASNLTMKRPYLSSKFVVGSARSDRINFSQAQKVFHSGDVKPEALEAKRTVQKKKQPNILGTEKDDWNQSTIADPKVEKGQKKDLKRQLLKVRAGLLDEIVVKPSKMHSDEAIAERHKYIVATTGKGPIGMLTGKWFNHVDERGLPSHSCEDKWNDWNHSTATHTKEDQKEATALWEEKEARRKRMMQDDPHLDKEAYVNPTQSISNVNDRLRERKVDFQDLKEQFKRELKVEFPNASEERLQAMAQRLLNEKLLADEKMARFPVQHESFRPNLSLTTQDRRYKMYHHPGTYVFSEMEKRYCWSCCMAFDKDAKGCEYKVCNPDSWCTLGFERYYSSRDM